MSKTIGIDLGTTNSCVSVVEGGRPVIIPNENGGRTTPSIVAFTPNGERLVGAAAARQLAVNPDRTICSIKRSMGTGWRRSIDTHSYTPQEISSMILAKLKKDAEAYLGETVTDAVITVPAYFNDTQRQATKDAGRIAGLNVKRIINEPTSAALAYGLDHGVHQRILVYDLGGGTFDVSVIEIGDGVIEVLSTAGNNHLGGDDFDHEIVEWMAAEFKRSQGVDLHKDTMAMARLREAAEQAKKELSGADRAEITLPYLVQAKQGPVHLEATLTRTQFNRLTDHLVQATAGPVQHALQDAGISARDLGMVLLVGGSTRIPAVQDMVRRLTGHEPSRSINPDECVAQGAAIQGETLSGSPLSSTQGAGTGILLLDVTPMSLSIETVGGVATRLIARNATLPVKYSQVFSTAAPFQRQVEINVLQGERPMAVDNKSIGRFRLTGIKPAPAGVPQIEVTFAIDTNGILQVSARDMDTGRSQSITISGDTRMSDAEVREAIRNAEMYAAEDRLRTQAIAAVNDATRLLNRCDRALSVAGKQIDKAESKQIRAEMKALQKILGKKQAARMTDAEISAVKEAIAHLDLATAHLFDVTGI